MSEDRGSVLTSNILAFGIAAFCFVSVRTGFRIYTKKISASDWLIIVALVSDSLPIASQGRINAGTCSFKLLTIWANGDATDLIARPGCFQCRLLVISSLQSFSSAVFGLIPHLQALPNMAMVITREISRRRSALHQSL